MLIVLSPAKTLDFESPIVDLEPTRPEFAADSRQLIARLRQLSAADLASLMTLSPALAELNVARYAAFRATPRPGQSRPAVLAFDGDVYDGLAARRLDVDGLAFAQQHVRILSGLYGVLRPLDAMQPHRLEMGTRLSTERGANLYGFWGDKPARALKRAMREAGGRVLINLASDEYSRVIDRDVLGAKIIAPVFQERRKAGWQVISFSAKRARGLMARYAIDHRITEPDGLKAFAQEGYAFDAADSDATTWYFRREAP
jgi:cytoplasmic iron level regulating protein YaaA (DUF328/UPF0246 family)